MGTLSSVNPLGASERYPNIGAARRGKKGLIHTRLNYTSKYGTKKGKLVFTGNVGQENDSSRGTCGGVRRGGKLGSHPIEQSWRQHNGSVSP